MGDVQGFIDSLVPVVESPYKYYTVRIDLNNPDPETSCTYMEDAVGMTPGYDGWKDTNLISGIRPCAMDDSGEIIGYYTNKEDMSQGYTQTLAAPPNSSPDIMIEFPLMGYKLWNDDSYQYVSVTDDPNAEDKGYCYYAHSLNTEKDCDKIYIGAFLGYVEVGGGGSYRLRSITTVESGNVTPTAETSLTDFRTYAANSGSGYSPISFFPWTLLQCLYVIIYKNLNSQAALGQGYTGGSATDVVGTTLSQPFCYGDPNDDTTHVKFLGIEDFYGNLYSWLDGVYNDNSFNILTDYRNSQFVGDSHDFQFNTPSGLSTYTSDNIKAIQGTNNSGFVLKSTDSNSNYNTYFSDYGDVAPGRFGSCGGSWRGGANTGAFRLSLDYPASRSSSGLGARLMYKHLASSGGGITPEPDTLDVVCYDLSRIFKNDMENNINNLAGEQVFYYSLFLGESPYIDDNGQVNFTYCDPQLYNIYEYENTYEFIVCLTEFKSQFTIVPVFNNKEKFKNIHFNINIENYINEKTQLKNNDSGINWSILDTNINSGNDIFYANIEDDPNVFSIDAINHAQKLISVSSSDITYYSDTIEFDIDFYFFSFFLTPEQIEEYAYSDKTLNINILYANDSYLPGKII